MLLCKSKNLIKLKKRLESITMYKEIRITLYTKTLNLLGIILACISVYVCEEKMFIKYHETPSWESLPTVYDNIYI